MVEKHKLKDQGQTVSKCVYQMWTVFLSHQLTEQHKTMRTERFIQHEARGTTCTMSTGLGQKIRNLWTQCKIKKD